METARLLIRHMKEADEQAFIRGIADQALRTAYGFPAEMDDAVPPQIFRHFCGLRNAFALVEKNRGEMTGFLLDTDPELPEEARSALPENGHTLAFAIFPAFQRKGYMEEAMRAYIPYLFSNTGTGYIHCGHFTENVPSRELLHKLEFREYSKHTLKDRTIVDEIRFRCACKFTENSSCVHISRL